MNLNGHSLLSLLKTPPGTWEARRAQPWACALGLGQELPDEAWLELEQLPQGKVRDDRGYHPWHYWAYHGLHEENGLRLAKVLKQRQKKLISRLSQEKNLQEKNLQDKNLQDKNLEEYENVDQEHPWHILCMGGHSSQVDRVKSWWGEMTHVRPTIHGVSLAHAMAWSGHSGWLNSRFKFMWQKPVDLDHQGLSPLMISIHRGDLFWVQSLLEWGLDPNEQDHQGKTALHHAALYGEPELFNVLLDANADVTIKDHQGLSARQLFKMREGHLQEKDIASLKEHWHRRKLQVLKFI